MKELWYNKMQERFSGNYEIYKEIVNLTPMKKRSWLAMAIHKLNCYRFKILSFIEYVKIYGSK